MRIRFEWDCLDINKPFSTPPPKWISSQRNARNNATKCVIHQLNSFIHSIHKHSARFPNATDTFVMYTRTYNIKWHLHDIACQTTQKGSRIYNSAYFMRYAYTNNNYATAASWWNWKVRALAKISRLVDFFSLSFAFGFIFIALFLLIYGVWMNLAIVLLLVW